MLYSNHGFLVAGPQRDGDVLGLFEALREQGVEVVAFNERQIEAGDFSGEGLGPLALIAGLLPSVDTAMASASVAVVSVIHQSVSPSMPPACTTLSDGTGVWVLRLDQASGNVAYYCPFR